jgi:hypothetical protein
LILETIAVEAGMLAGKAAVQRILGLQPETVRLLQAADGKLDLLREGPYHAGRAFVAAAARAGDDADRRDRELEKARDRFMDAQGTLRGDAMMSSLADLHIALIEHTVGHSTEATHWAAEAHTHAVRAVRERLVTVAPLLAKHDQRARPPVSKKSVASAAGGMGAGLVATGVGVAVVPVLGLLAGAGLAASTYLERRRARTGEALLAPEGPVADVRSLAAYVTAIGNLRAGLGEPRSKIDHYQLDLWRLPHYELVA